MNKLELIDGYDGNTKIIHLKDVKILVQDFVYLDNSCIQFLNLESFVWIKEIFKQKVLESIIFYEDRIVITKFKHEFWPKVLAVVIMFFDLEFENLIELDLKELEKNTSMYKDKLQYEKDSFMMGIIIYEIDKNIKKTINDHGGDVIVSKIDSLNKLIYFKLIGSCSNCTNKKNYIERFLIDLINRKFFNYKVEFIQ